MGARTRPGDPSESRSRRAAPRAEHRVEGRARSFQFVQAQLFLVPEADGVVDQAQPGRPEDPEARSGQWTGQHARAGLPGEQRGDEGKAAAVGRDRVRKLVRVDQARVAAQLQAPDRPPVLPVGLDGARDRGACAIRFWPCSVRSSERK